MPYQPTTNFRDSNNVDLGKKLVTKDYLLSVYGSLLDTLAPGLNFTPNLLVWGGGDNNSGVLGNNTNTIRSTPVTTFAGGTNWKQVSCGYQHSAAIKTDGTLWIWGVGSSGRLGINVSADRSTPVTTFAGGTNWKQVACGGYFTAAIKTDGTLWTWGSNISGVLGTNDTPGKTTPVTTFTGGTNWKQVYAGQNFVTAIKTDGTLWTWGNNSYGKLGDNTIVNRSTPVTTFAGGTNWKQVSGTMAIKTDGTLWTWGRNGYGQLGINTTVDKSTPVTTFAGGTNWKQVGSSSGNLAAIKTDGTLWVAGSRISGQLGTNDTSANRLTPITTLAGGTNWKQVSSFGGNPQAFMMAIKTDGTLWTWGDNQRGTAGVNESVNKATPVTTFAGGNNWKSVGVFGAATAGGGNPMATAIQSVDYI